MAKYKTSLSNYAAGGVSHSKYLFANRRVSNTPICITKKEKDVLIKSSKIKVKTSQKMKQKRHFSTVIKNKQPSIRKIYRQTMPKISISTCKTIVPATVACHRDEIDEFINFGPDMCVPDFNRIDSRSIRNWIKLEERGLCFMELTAEDIHTFCTKCRLLVDEPNYNERNKSYSWTGLPDFLPEVTTSPNMKENSLLLLQQILAKYGGSLHSLSVLECTRNCSMSPHLYRNGSRYGARVMEMTKPKAVLLCNHCNTPNILWLEHETTGLNDQFCGICSNGLDEQLVTPQNTAIDVEADGGITQLRVGAQQLAIAETSLNLDGTPDLSNNLINKFIDQDIRNVRATLSRCMRKTITVSNGIDDYQMKYLTMNCPSMVLVMNRGTPNPHAMLAAERKICWNLFVDKAEKNQIIMDIGSRNCRDKKLFNRWRGMGPSLDWRDIERYANNDNINSCAHTAATCDCLRGKQPLLISIDSIYDIPPDHIVKLMQTVDSNQLLFTVSTANINFNLSQGQLAYNQGVWYRHDGKLITSLEGDDRPYVNDWWLTQMWTTADIIQVDNITDLHINTIKILGNHKLRVITMTQHSLSHMRCGQNKQRIGNTIPLTIPMVESDSWLSVTQIPVLVDKSITIDVHLFRALYSRNLTGGLSLEKMIEYGLAYAHVKYTTTNATITHGHISADDVRLHALLATVASRRKRMWVDNILNLNDPDSLTGMSATPKLMLGLIESVLSTLMDNVLTYKNESDMNLNNITNGLHGMVMKWLGSDFWCILDELLNNRLEEDVVLYNWPGVTTDIKTLHHGSICAHHTPWCDHQYATDNLCDCCGIVEKMEGSESCKCCKNKFCHHECAHVCKGMSDHDGQGEPKMCECCKVMYTTEICNVCVNKYKKHPNYPEPPLLKKTYDLPTKLSKTRAKTGVFQQYLQTHMGNQSKSNQEKDSDKDAKQPAEKYEDYKIIDEQPTTTDKMKEQLNNESKEEPSTSEQDKIPEKLEEDQEVDVSMEPYLKTILKNTTSEYYLVVLNGMSKAIANLQCTIPDHNPKGVIGRCTIKYTPMGTVFTERENFRVVCTADVAGDGLCGYNAIKKIHDNVSLTHMQKYLKKTDFFSTQQLIKYLNHLGYNSMIMVPSGVYINTADPNTEVFTCLIGNPVTPKSELLHWEPVSVQQIGISSFTPTYKHMFTETDVDREFDRLGKYNRLPNNAVDAQIMVIANLIERYQSKTAIATNNRMVFNVFAQDKEFYFTNNEKRIHNPKYGMFSFKFPPKHEAFFKLMTQNDPSFMTKSFTTTVLSIPDNIPDDVSDIKDNLIHDKLLTMTKLLFQARGQIKQEQNEWIAVLVSTKRSSQGLRKLELTDYKLKTGDIISVQTMGSLEERCILQNDNSYYCIDWLSSQAKQVTTKIYIPKISFKSAMLQLNNWCRQHIDINEFKNLLTKSSATIGPAGSGKTTILVSNVKKGDIIIARTRVAVETISHKLGKNAHVTVSTFEKFMQSNQICNTLHIDEATMFTWYDLMLNMIYVPDRMMLYGDNSQVGVIDTYMSGGERSLSNIIHLIRDVKKLTKTHRFGPSLCAQLAPSIGYIESTSKFDTQIFVRQLDSWNEEAIIELVKKHEPDVILTHHQKDKRRLSLILGTTQCIETIHAFQSKEASKVMVVQIRSNDNTTLWANKHYNVSAATRCKGQLIWVAIGMPSKMPLSELIKGDSLTVEGGGKRSLSEMQEDEEATISRLNKLRKTIEMIVEEDVSCTTQTQMELTQPTQEIIEDTESKNKFEFVVVKQNDNELENGLVSMEMINSLDSLYSFKSMPIIEDLSLSKILEMAKNTADDLPMTRFDYINDHNYNINTFGVTIQSRIHNERHTCYNNIIGNWVTMKLVSIKIENIAKQAWKDRLKEVFYGKPKNEVFMLVNEHWIPKLKELWKIELHTEGDDMKNELNKKHKTTDEQKSREEKEQIEHDRNNITSSEYDWQDALDVHTTTEDETSSTETVWEDAVDDKIGLPKCLFPVPITDGQIITLVKSVLKYKPQQISARQLNNFTRIITMEDEMGVICETEHTRNDLGVKVINGYAADKVQLALDELHTKMCDKYNLNDNIIGSAHLLKEDQINELIKQNNWLVPLTNFKRNNIDTHLLLKEFNDHIEIMKTSLTNEKDSDNEIIIPQHIEEKLIADRHKICKSKRVFSPMNSDNNDHYCDESEAWWNKNEDKSATKQIAQISHRQNRTIRLLCEHIQLANSCNMRVEMRGPTHKYELSTFNGCSLCAGLVAKYKGEVVIKIGPQRKAKVERAIDVNTNINHDIVTEILCALDILYTATVDDVGNTSEQLKLVENNLPIQLQQDWYELGIIYERLSIIPSFLKQYISLESRDNKPLCTMFNDSNLQHQLDLEQKVSTHNWHVSMIGYTKGHIDARTEAVKITNGKQYGCAFLCNGIWYCDIEDLTTIGNFKLASAETILNLIYENKLNSWPWKTAYISTIGGKLANLGVGFNLENDISGLNLPMSYHITNRTVVYNYIQSKQDEQKLASIKKVKHIVFINQYQLNQYRELLIRDCVNMPIEMQCYDTLEQGFDELVEQIHIKYFYNGMERDEEATLITDFPYMPLLTSAWGMLATKNPYCTNHRYAKNLLDCNSMINKLESIYFDNQTMQPSNADEEAYQLAMQNGIRNQQKGEDGPWYTRKTTKFKQNCKTVLLGLTGLQLSINELIELMNELKTQKLSLICPTKLTDSNSLFNWVSKDDTFGYIRYDSSEELTKVNLELINTILTGTVIQKKGFGIVTHCSNDVLGHSTVNIILTPGSDYNPSYVKPLTHQHMDSLVTFNVPVIHNIRQFLESGHVLKTKKISMSHKLYRALSLRMLRPGTDFDDLLAYARTYSHAVAYTISGSTSKQPSVVQQMMENCACVYFESSRLNNTCEKLFNLITKPEGDLFNKQSWKETLEFIGIKMLSELFSHLGSNIKFEDIENIISELALKSNYGLIKNLSKIKIVRLTKRNRPPNLIFMSKDSGQHTLRAKQDSDDIEKLSDQAEALYDIIKRIEETHFSHDLTSQVRIQTDQQKPTCISKLCEKLEEQVGEQKQEAIVNVLPSLINEYDHNEVMSCIKKIYGLLPNRIELEDKYIQTLGNNDHRIQHVINNLRAKNKRISNVCFSESSNNMLARKARIMWPELIDNMQSKKITFSTIGSRGDLEPYVSMAQWWSCFGVSCWVACPVDYTTLMSEMGLSVIPINIESKDLIESCIKMEENKWNPIKFYQEMKKMFSIVQKVVEIDASLLQQAVQESDLVIETPFTHITGQIAQKFNKPLIYSTPYPWEHHVGVSTSMERMSITEILAGALTFLPFKTSITKWRQNILGMAGDEDLHTYTYGSPMLYMHHDITRSWPIGKQSSCIGYGVRVSDQADIIDVETCIWASTGTCIAICFGSMTGQRRKLSTKRLVEKLSMVMEKFVIVDGQMDISDITEVNTDRVRIIPSADYNLLFEVVDMVACHGGSGTTHNAMIHSCILIIDPHFGDQFAWLKTVKRLRVGAGFDDVCAMTQEQIMTWYNTSHENVAILAHSMEKEDFRALLITNWEKMLKYGSQYITGINNKLNMQHIKFEWNTNDRITNLKFKNIQWSEMEEDRSFLHQIQCYMNADIYFKTLGVIDRIKSVTPTIEKSTTTQTKTRDQQKTTKTGKSTGKFVSSMMTKGESSQQHMTETKPERSTGDQSQGKQPFDNKLHVFKKKDAGKNKQSEAKHRPPNVSDEEYATKMLNAYNKKQAEWGHKQEQDEPDLIQIMGKLIKNKELTTKEKRVWDKHLEEGRKDKEKDSVDKHGRSTSHQKGKVQVLHSGKPIIQEESDNLTNEPSEKLEVDKPSTSSKKEKINMDDEEVTKTEEQQSDETQDKKLEKPTTTMLETQADTDPQHITPTKNKEIADTKSCQHDCSDVEQQNICKKLWVNFCDNPSCSTSMQIARPNYKTIYNPTSDGNCVEDCLKWLNKELKLYSEGEFNIMIHDLYLWMNITGLPTINNIDAILKMIKLSCVLIKPTSTKKYNITDVNKIQLGLLVTENKGIGHCQGVWVEGGLQPSPELNESKEISLPHDVYNELKEETSKLTLGETDIKNLCSKVFCNKCDSAEKNLIDTAYTIEEMAIKLKAKNLVHTIRRKKNPIKSLDLLKDGNVYYTRHRTTNAKCVWILFSDGWRLGVTYQCDPYTLFFVANTSHDASCKNIMLETEINIKWKWASKSIPTEERKIRHYEKERVTALNNATLQFAKSHSTDTIITTVQDDNCGIVAVAEYDNRAHHKYDDRTFLMSKGLAKTIGLGFNMTKQIWDHITHRGPGMRFNIRRGKFMASIEFKTIEQAMCMINIFTKEKITCERAHTSLYLDLNSVSEYTIEKLEEWAKLMQAENGEVTKYADQILECRNETPADKLMTWFDISEDSWNSEVGSDIKKFLIQACLPKGSMQIGLSNAISFEMIKQDSTHLFLRNACVLIKLIPVMTGGGEPSEYYEWKSDTDQLSMSVSRWWNIPTNTKNQHVKFDMTRYLQLNTEALVNGMYENQTIKTENVGFTDPWKSDLEVLDIMPHVFPSETEVVNSVETLASEELANYDVRVMWDDTDLSDWNEKYAPINDVTIISRLPATQLRISNKSTLTEYPIYSRPVLTKTANAEFNACTGRLCRVETYRKHQYNLRSEIAEFVNTWFDPNKQDLLQEFQSDMLTYNDSKALEWLAARPDSNKIAKELETKLDEGWQVHPINDINVHLKLESLLKSEPANSMKQVKPRALMWQCKAYCAVFSHMFKEIKTRLKRMLRPNVLYADGLRADELAARVRLVKDFNWFLENDLAQQDRQTDNDIINFEMEVYKLLGMHPATVELWRKSHVQWKYKARTVKGVRDAMRLTGQATTAIGNAITNLLVHRRLAQSMKNNLKLFLVLGDDGLMLCKDKVDTSKLNHEFKSYHNMMCKPNVSTKFGVFCCMIVTRNHLGTATLGPDLVRLRRRFEVTNGVSEATDENVRARIMSYCMMLGKTPMVKRIIDKHSLPIEPTNWYDNHSIKEAIACKYDMSIDQVNNEEKLLGKMMMEPTVITRQFLHWEETI